MIFLKMMSIIPFGFVIILSTIFLVHIIKYQIEIWKLTKENKYKQKWCKHKRKGYSYLPNGAKICKNCYSIIGFYNPKKGK